jgi:formate dehydrogenase maturation protein FdhE
MLEYLDNYKELYYNVVTIKTRHKESKMIDEFVNCPKCKSPNIGAGEFNSEYAGGWRTCKCDNCDFEWVEVFHLISNRDAADENDIDENGYGHNEDFTDGMALDESGDPINK